MSASQSEQHSSAADRHDALLLPPLLITEEKMTALLSSFASINTDRPQRWATQLVSHLGHKVPVESTHDGYVLPIGNGLGCVSVKDDVLLLKASATDVESLEHVENVLARHLERFAAREGLSVDWTR